MCSAGSIETFLHLNSRSRTPRRASKQAAAKRESRARTACKLALVNVTEQTVRISPARKLRSVRTAVRRKFPGASSISRHMKTTKNIDVAPRTVRRDLRRKGPKAYRQPRGHELSDDQRRVRVAFAKKVLRMPKSLRETLMFSDEKYFDTRSPRRFHYWSNGREMRRPATSRAAPRSWCSGSSLAVRSAS